jgi:osmotically-inducible protein OsmY
MIATSPNLNERVDAAIQTSPYLAGQQLRFEAADGRVVLKGVVRSYFQKQMAQETLRRIDGIVFIENDLEVTWS